MIHAKTFRVGLILALLFLAVIGLAFRTRHVAIQSETEAIEEQLRVMKDKLKQMEKDPEEWQRELRRIDAEWESLMERAKTPEPAVNESI